MVTQTYTHTHISYAIQSLALAWLVCSTHPCEWYLESPCPAPISVPPSRGVDVSQLGVAAIAKARYWPDLMPSLPVNSVPESLSRHLPGLLPCSLLSVALVFGLQRPEARRAPVFTVGNAGMDI